MIDVVVLFFLLGLFARLVRSELRLPEALYDRLLAGRGRKPRRTEP